MGNFFKSTRRIFRHAWVIVKQSLRVLKCHPQILVYPYLAVAFILITSSFVGRLVISLWQRVDTPEVVGQVTQAAPHELTVHLGLVTFSVFYTIFVTAYFICMISASTLAELRGRSPSMFYGLKAVLDRFWRVTNFALLAIFFLPMGLIAQAPKMKSLKGIWDAITNSFSLSMAQLAPAIMVGKQDVFETVKHAVETLGQLSKESLVIRIGTFLMIVVLGSLSFLPKLIEVLWFESTTAHAIGWILTVLLGVASYVVLKVISAVSTTIIYDRAASRKS